MNHSTTLALAPRVPHDQRKRSARLSWGESLPPYLRPILLSALLLLPASLLPAQTPAQQTPPQQGPVLHTPPAKPEQAPAPATTTLSVDARLVNLPVVVRDKKGALIQTLTKDDFVLKVDEHPQAIRYFDLDSNLTWHLGGLTEQTYWQLLREVIVADHDPENVVLLEIDPHHQKTLPDFHIYEDKLHIAIVDIAKLLKQDELAPL